MAVWNSVSNIWSAVTSRIYLLTWNVHGTSPPSDLTDLLSLNETTRPDIYAIGLQELETDDWESTFQTVLKDYDYVKVKRRRLQGILTILFVKRCHLGNICNIESEVTKTGFKGYWGNKGAASIRMDFMGLNLIVVNSHLAAHMEGLKERIASIYNIIDGQKFRDRDTDNLMDHDYIFWMGDMNFRLEKMPYSEALDIIQSQDYKKLLKSDQLTLVMDEGLVFDGFHEGKVNFPPTYKFDVGTDNYDTSALQRVPSYTDRILYFFHDTQYGQLKLLAKSVQYRSHPSYKISDHKPVSSVIEINVMARGTFSPVTFDISTNPWSKFVTNKVVYNIRRDFVPSLWDWIGIYKADFADLNSQVTFVWASVNYKFGSATAPSAKMSVPFNNVHLNDIPDGEYVLCYISRKGSLCGISKSFTISS